MRHGSLFNGIGGFQLAAHWMGWQNVFHCEIDPYCNQVVKKYFPQSVCYGNIKKTSFKKWKGQIEILTGGDPCQPSSVTGKRKGKADPRYLWPEQKRAVSEIMPHWVVNENVPGSISNGIVDEKITDLESIGYTCWPPLVIPASASGAPHKRNRVWIVAYTVSQVLQKRTGQSSLAQAKIKTPAWKDAGFYTGGGLIAAAICRNDHGISNRVDRIKALGNAVVPKAALLIFQAIQNFIDECTTADRILLPFYP